MKQSRSILSAGMLIAILAPGLSGAAEIVQHTDMCDASAAVPVGAAMFVVANDEDNVLRVYIRDKSSGPLFSVPMEPFLKTKDKHPEADIEGATRIGNRIYWITSHGANKEGKERPNRRRLFATELQVTGDRVELVPVGTPYRNLVEDLAKVKELEKFDLARAATKPPEKKEGLNIEGLSRTPDGALLIAFRNPIPDGKALVVPLQNPEEVIDGKAAKLGKPMLLDLGGLGVRSIEYTEAEGKYLIVAGPYDDTGEFRLYRWSGVPTAAPELVAGIDFQGLRPEAVVVYPEEKTRIQMLSDDGAEPVKGEQCKDEKIEPKDKRFRSLWMSP